jgi:hypothetical protein
VKITQAGNYNFMGYHLENGSFENLVISEGYDGIHIRGGKNIVIRNCDIQTGDDAIAGGWWENTVISNCFINSTCNGIRLIYPATDFEIGHCQFKGPGTYPQRSVKSLRNKKQMKAAIILQPGAWQDCEGLLDKVYIHDVEIADVENALTTDLKRGNWCGEVIIERMKATGINKSAFQLQSYFGGIHEDVVVRDIDIQYVVSGTEEIGIIDISKAKIKNEYNSDMDAAFYEKNPRRGGLVLEEGDFAIFYPNDLHMPGLSFEDKASDVKKIVVKVSV